MKFYHKTMAAFLALFGSIAPALAQDMPGHYEYWREGWGWNHMIFGSLMMVLFWGGVILLVVLVVRWIGGGVHYSGGTPAHGPRPMDILEERFARGEIDQEEFENRKRVLSK